MSSESRSEWLESISTDATTSCVEAFVCCVVADICSADAAVSSAKDAMSLVSRAHAVQLDA